MCRNTLLVGGLGATLRGLRGMDLMHLSLRWTVVDPVYPADVARQPPRLRVPGVVRWDRRVTVSALA